MFSSLSESGFIPTPDSIQFNLYSIIKFSSLSESGFIPTVRQDGRRPDERATGSHLFQRVASFLLKSKEMLEQFKKGLFSSLSESGFIPTRVLDNRKSQCNWKVLISFREWLHSYRKCSWTTRQSGPYVLISFREWLHSYKMQGLARSKGITTGSHLFQRVASFLLNPDDSSNRFSSLSVLISFREWLHSYSHCLLYYQYQLHYRSHLFQRVASFLPKWFGWWRWMGVWGFSSLSESGFIPTRVKKCLMCSRKP